MAATFTKIWELVRDETIPKCPQGVVVPPSEQVSMVVSSYTEITIMTFHI
jgi:hypothetical protein